MDHHEKLCLFGLYTSLKSHGASLTNEMFDEANEVHNHYPEATWLTQILLASKVTHLSKVPNSSLFNKVCSHCSDDNHTTFLVNVTAHFTQLDIDFITKQFNVIDFYGVLGDYFSLKQTQTPNVVAKGAAQPTAYCCSCQFIFGQVFECSNTRHSMTAMSFQLTPSRHCLQIPPCHMDVVTLFSLMTVMNRGK